MAELTVLMTRSPSRTEPASVMTVSLTPTQAATDAVVEALGAAWMNDCAHFQAGDTAEALVERLEALHDHYALTDDGARWAVDAALPHLRQAALTGHDLWFSLD